MNEDYKILYELKCTQFKQLNDQFHEYQEQSNFIISDLQEETKELKKKIEGQSKQLTQIKEKRKNNTSNYQKQIEIAKKEKEQFRAKFIDFEKKVIELENINENLQSDLRATRATLGQYQQRIQKTMEQLASLQMQMEENTENSQEQIARLRSQLKETQDEIYAWQFRQQNSENKVDEPKMEENKENQNQSFQSKQDSEFKKGNKLSSSKTKKRNPKFIQTLNQIRNYIKTIAPKTDQISKKIQQMLI